MSKLYPLHVPISAFTRPILAATSAVVTLADPYRHDMLATLAETSTPLFMLAQSRDRMLKVDSGTRILKERPIINSKTVDLQVLSKLPEGTVGKTYINWLVNNKVSPDTRAPVRYVDDEELAYVMLRYRQSHDFYHLLFHSLPTDLLNELLLKQLEASHFNWPMTNLSATFGPLRLGAKRYQAFRDIYKPWAIQAERSLKKDLLSIYWEEQWERPIRDLRDEMGVIDIPTVGRKSHPEVSR